MPVPPSMLAAIALALLAQAPVAPAPLPRAPDSRADVAFSGFPAGLVGPNQRVLSHSVVIQIGTDRARVSSTTLVKSTWESSALLALQIPRLRSGPLSSTAFPVAASWDGKPLSLTPQRLQPGSTLWPLYLRFQGMPNATLSAGVELRPQATGALRVAYEVPLGRGLRDRQKRAVGYLLDTFGPIGILDIAVKTEPGAVFGLLEVPSGAGWEIGGKGAWARFRNWPGDASGILLVSFYPGGFRDIGS